MQERKRMLTEYFPKRLNAYLKQLREKGWYDE